MRLDTPVADINVPTSQNEVVRTISQAVQHGNDDDVRFHVPVAVVKSTLAVGGNSTQNGRRQGRKRNDVRIFDVNLSAVARRQYYTRGAFNHVIKLLIWILRVIGLLLFFVIGCVLGVLCTLALAFVIVLEKVFRKNPFCAFDARQEELESRLATGIGRFLTFLFGQPCTRVTAFLAAFASSLIAGGALDLILTPLILIIFAIVLYSLFLFVIFP